MDLYSAPNGTLTPTEPHPSHTGPLLCAPRQGTGVPSLCEALAARLELAAIVDVDYQVRDALVLLGEWLRTGDYGTVEIARWLVTVHRDVQPW
jgi:hypothetical protein